MYEDVSLGSSNDFLLGLNRLSNKKFAIIRRSIIKQKSRVASTYKFIY